MGDTFFLCIDADYAEGSVRQTAQTAVQTSAMECDRYLNGRMSEGERALVIHDYLVADITYAYEEDGETPQDDAWAHNISGWALYDAGVCETYAETFTYLCDLFEVESSVVTGYAAQTGAMGGHAWNILCLDDEWYNVDVTWDDGYEKNDASLVGREWFGVPATEFARNHVADTPDGGLGGSYQFALPTLSEKSLSPVVFGEKYGEKTWCVSIDAAFEKMTNEGGYVRGETLSDLASARRLQPDTLSFGRSVYSGDAQGAGALLHRRIRLYGQVVGGRVYARPHLRERTRVAGKTRVGLRRFLHAFVGGKRVYVHLQKQREGISRNERLIS